MRIDVNAARGAMASAPGEHEPRILFIARAFPPTVGGMENLALRLSGAMSARTHVATLINHRGKKALPAFLPYAFGAAVRIARAEGIDAIHLADALLAPLGVMLKRATGLPVTASVCGLDVTYPNRFYQALVPRALAQLDMTMPISRATADELHARAGAGTPSTVIPLGINPLPLPAEGDVRAFRDLADLRDQERVLLTVGRLIRRKGAAWFARNVLPLLPDDAVYVIAGEGPEREAIEVAAYSAGVSHRVRLLGRIDDALLAAAYAGADVFVMPNIAVAGDIEGFGLVAIEASAAGLPVVASQIQGIAEALSHERNALLVPAGDAESYAATIAQLMRLPVVQLRELGADFGRFTRKRYSWDQTARRYIELISDVVAAKTGAVPQELRAA
jgi:glycosyltransferase involved in cell wall biosynthesis